MKSPLRLLKDELLNKGYITRLPKLIMETPNKIVYVVFEDDMYVVKMFDKKTSHYDYSEGFTEFTETVERVVQIAEMDGKFCTRGKNY